MKSDFLCTPIDNYAHDDQYQLLNFPLGQGLIGKEIAAFALFFLFSIFLFYHDQQKRKIGKSQLVQVDQERLHPVNKKQLPEIVNTPYTNNKTPFVSLGMYLLLHCINERHIVAFLYEQLTDRKLKLTHKQLLLCCTWPWLSCSLWQMPLFSIPTEIHKAPHYVHPHWSFSSCSSSSSSSSSSSCLVHNHCHCNHNWVTANYSL